MGCGYSDKVQALLDSNEEVNGGGCHGNPQYIGDTLKKVFGDISRDLHKTCLTGLSVMVWNHYNSNNSIVDASFTQQGGEYHNKWRQKRLSFEFDTTLFERKSKPEEGLSIMQTKMFDKLRRIATKHDRLFTT